MSRPTLRLQISLFAAAILIVASGCSDSTGPELGTGSIVIDQTPDILPGADWSLSGPRSETGSGDVTLTDMVVGEYTLTWKEVAGHTTPPGGTQTMTPDATLTFSGNYLEVGTIEIEQTPDDLIGAGWTLAGPHNQAGSGNLTLVNMPGGEYTLTWNSVVGWSSLPSSTQILAADGTVTFSGIYTLAADLTEGYVQIPPALVSMPVSFTMGSAVGNDETPHQVTLSHRISMAETEVTNDQFIEAMQWAFDQGHITVTTGFVLDAMDGSTSELLELDGEGSEINFSDGVFSTAFPDRPVGRMTWRGAAAFCDWVSMQVSLPRAYDHSTWICNDGNPYGAAGFRLPTEAEWEFACRAGTTTHFNTGDCLDAGTEANYNGEHPYTGCSSGPFLSRAADVGSYPPNAWGLFDMHGNLFEWCNDGYDNYNGDETDPVGAAAFSRVIRSGWWGDFEGAEDCRSASRFYIFLHNYSFYVGFRPVRTIH